MAALKGTVLFGTKPASGAPTNLQALLAAGSQAMQDAYNSLLKGEEIDPDGIKYLPPFPFRISKSPHSRNIR